MIAERWSAIEKHDTTMHEKRKVRLLIKINHEKSCTIYNTKLNYSDFVEGTLL